MYALQICHIIGNDKISKNILDIELFQNSISKYSSHS